MIRATILTVAAVFASSAIGSSPADAKPTRVTVRVIAKGAKFIGTSMGGATVVIRDVDTGEVLAKGLTRGGTGDTRKIMTEAAKRGTPVSTKGAAAFTATLDIEDPRLVEIVALGPQAQRQAAARASVTHWLVPGRHVTGGDGVVLELPGFVVDVLAPGAHSFVARAATTRIDASVTMMCGCTVEPGGLWDAKGFAIVARIKRDGKPIGERRLKYAGKPNRFTAAIDTRRPGVYHVVVYAFDPANGNTGVDATTFVVKK